MTKKLMPCLHQALEEKIFSFTKLIALGYYDGPNSGVIKCNLCETEYFFDVPFQKVIEEIDLYIVLFSVLPSGSYSKLINLLSLLGPVREPVWVPLWKFASEKKRIETEKELDIILASKAPPSMVMVWEMPDGLIKEVKLLNPHEDYTRLHSADDWLNFMKGKE